MSYDAAAAVEDESRETSVADEAPVKVLVVDDNVDIVNSMAQYLELCGHQPARAYNGEEALLQAEAFKPAVMLLDLGMPGMSGLEVARHLRDKPWGKGVVIIAVTAWGDLEHRARTASAGFDAHLVKPVDLTKLLLLIETMGRP